MSLSTVYKPGFYPSYTATRIQWLILRVSTLAILSKPNHFPEVAPLNIAVGILPSSKSHQFMTVGKTFCTNSGG